MSHGFQIERHIDATADEVFEALTDPATQREWWSPNRAVDAECDLRVGGRAHVQWTAEEGHTCRAEQVFVEIDRPRLLVYRETVIEPSSPVYECTLTITLEERDGKTLFTLVHEGFPTEAERDKHERGTGIFLDRLTRYVSRAPV